MSDKQMFVLLNEQIRQRAARAVLDAAEGFAVRITPPTRNLEQSAKFHAICGDLARQLPYAGKKRTLEQWKALLCSGHSVATQENDEIVPGLEQEWLNLRESTASMSVARMSSLIEYSLAYCAMNGVRTTG